MMLANRLRKRQRHLKKWARRQEISCYRLYERDIPEYPLIIDWIDGDLIVWVFDRQGDHATENDGLSRDHLLAEINEGLDLSAERIFFKVRSRQKGLQQQYERLGRTTVTKIVEEEGLRFEVNLSDYVDVGLFLDHRQTRGMVRDLAGGKRVLNLFAYTGSFTCYALAGGATQTTTVDLSQTYCQWAKRNLLLNGFAPGQRHQILQEDCLQFLQSAVKKQRHYDLIICDPPTFSNSKRMNVSAFVVDRHHPQLIRDCMRLLNDEGTLIFSTNSRGFLLDGKLTGQFSVTEISEQTIPPDFRNRRIHRCWEFRLR